MDWFWLRVCLRKRLSQEKANKALTSSTTLRAVPPYIPPLLCKHLYAGRHANVERGHIPTDMPRVGPEGGVAGVLGLRVTASRLHLPWPYFPVHEARYPPRPRFMALDAIIARDPALSTAIPAAYAFR